MSQIEVCPSSGMEDNDLSACESCAILRAFSSDYMGLGEFTFSVIWYVGILKSQTLAEVPWNSASPTGNSVIDVLWLVDVDTTDVP